MRCTECNKFRGQDSLSDPDVTVETDDDGVVTGTVRIVNLCDDCGAEMTANDFDVEIDLSDAVAAHASVCHAEHEAFTLTLEDDTAIRTERTCRNRRYYGFKLSVTLRCSCHCTANADGHAVPGVMRFEGSAEDDVAASDMEELMW